MTPHNLFTAPGFGLDEGLANETNKFTVFYGERVPWCESLDLNKA